MAEDHPVSSDQEEQSGAAIEEEIGDLSSELERQPPPKEAPTGARPEARRRILDSPWLAAVLLAVAAALTVANIVGVGPSKRDQPDPSLSAPRDPLRETLLFAVEEIETYRDEEGRLPRDLDDIGMTEDIGLAYSSTGDDAYTLTATDGAKTLSFSSTEDPETFFGELWAGP